MHVVTFKQLPNHGCLFPTLLIKDFQPLLKSYPITSRSSHKYLPRATNYSVMFFCSAITLPWTGLPMKS